MSFIYINRHDEMIKPLAGGEKAVSVSDYKDQIIIHIRLYATTSSGGKNIPLVRALHLQSKNINIW